jgi:flagellar basal body-associated protein FliL
MTQPNIKIVKVLILFLIIVSLLIISGVTGLYYWKGLQELKPKQKYATTYFVFY